MIHQMNYKNDDTLAEEMANVLVNFDGHCLEEYDRKNREQKNTRQLRVSQSWERGL